MDADTSIYTRYVFPNHYLLKLAERPPENMASLKSFFQPMPPIVRKRATELLGVIKDSVVGPGIPVSRADPTPTEEAMPVVQEVNMNSSVSAILWTKGNLHELFCRAMFTFTM
jgi:HRDC domain